MLAQAVKGSPIVIIDVCLAQVTGELVKTGIVALQSGFQVLQEGYAAAEPTLKQVYEQAAPVVSEVASQVSKVAAPAFKSAAPIISVRSSGPLKQFIVQEGLVGVGLRE